MSSCANAMACAGEADEINDRTEINRCCEDAVLFEGPVVERIAQLEQKLVGQAVHVKSWRRNRVVYSKPATTVAGTREKGRRGEDDLQLVQYFSHPPAVSIKRMRVVACKLQIIIFHFK